VELVRSKLLVVGGISGIAIPGGGLSAQVEVQWNHYLIESLMLFAHSGALTDTASLQLSIIDAITNETLISCEDGDQFMPALALVGKNPTMIFPGGPRWFRLRREVKPGDRWLFQVKGTAGIVPIFGLYVTELTPAQPRAA